MKGDLPLCMFHDATLVHHQKPVCQPRHQAEVMGDEEDADTPVLQGKYLPENRVLIKLSPVGEPHPTRGVRQAVRFMGDCIQERAPALKVLHSAV